MAEVVSLRKLYGGLFLLAFWIWPINETCAQYEIKALPRVMVSAHIDYMLPKAPIKKFSNHDEWGFTVEAQYRLMYNEPFMAGVYYSEAGLSRLTTKYSSSGTDIKEKANTRRLEAGFTAAAYPEFNWLLQPYVIGRIGLALFQSSSILTDRDEDEVIERISESTDYVLSYGLDLGIHIVPNIWYLRGDVRIGVVANPSATYLLLNPERIDGTTYPIEAFDEHTTPGRWLKVSAGVSYLF